MIVCPIGENEDDMKQRMNAIWERLFGSWKSFTKYITPVFYIGVIMVLMSVILITLHNGLLQAAGTAMLAAGLTIITTTLTSKESIRQQFAKDANITRKDAIYGPLFIELKQIYDWLDEAKKKEGRYPIIFMALAENQRVLNITVIEVIQPFFSGRSLNRITVLIILHLGQDCSLMKPSS